MLLTVIIFFIAIALAFSMLAFRAWEIKTERVKIPEVSESPIPDLSFRHVEKSMLYLTKHLVQGFVLAVAKYWFIFVTKTKKKVADSWPKLNAYFQKKQETSDVNMKPSFFRKAVLESEAKIKKIKEKIRKEHEENLIEK